MTLLATQRAFQAQVLAEDVPMPSGWDSRMEAGLAIYRNAYRGRLVDALRETYPRTAQWVGEDAFRQAAAHHLITQPPGDWTLDLAGHGFPETLAELFAGDPEVAELARLEWRMHCAYVGPDATALDNTGFAIATAAFAEEHWEAMVLKLVPTLTLDPISSPVAAIWQALTQGTPPPDDLALPEPAMLAVWREGLSPVFRTLDPLEGAALVRIRDRESFGTLCLRLQDAAPDGIARAGAMLARWVNDGMVAELG